ncbi:MAG TPA: TetR family transcriptional regulator [Solirubrobacteraceae bacterium]|nr:TetR family transcriptional regulator [Solirubrobacteraceae bacterium]
MSAAPTPYRLAARRLLRDSLFQAAREELRKRPWAQITMGEIARAAGVSRQTLYNELGSREEFAQAFVIGEGERFIEAVEAAVRANVSDPHAALAAALELFLSTAREDPFVRILLNDDGTGGMLPFVTTRGEGLVEWASARIAAVMLENWPRVAREDAELLADALVRLSISYVALTRESAQRTADAVARLLGPYVDRVLAGG